MLDRQTILTYAHKQSDILGDSKFPSILKTLWSSYRNYKGNVGTKNILASLKPGSISSIYLMGQLKRHNIDILYSPQKKGYIITLLLKILILK